jgi:hypothetical protein
VYLVFAVEFDCIDDACGELEFDEAFDEVDEVVLKSSELDEFC